MPQRARAERATCTTHTCCCDAAHGSHAARPTRSRMCARGPQSRRVYRPTSPQVGTQESGGRRALIVTCMSFAAPSAAETVPVAFAAVTWSGRRERGLTWTGLWCLVRRRTHRQPTCPGMMQLRHLLSIFPSFVYFGGKRAGCFFSLVQNV